MWSFTDVLLQKRYGMKAVRESKFGWLAGVYDIDFVCPGFGRRTDLQACRHAGQLTGFCSRFLEGLLHI
jgi:hypothetical protein